jgi:hypothetical protein
VCSSDLSDIPGRIINIKDAYGTFTNSSLTVYTQGGEAFEDGTNFRVLNNSWEQLQVYTASTTRWYITGGTEQVITTTNISVISTLQTFNWPSLCNTAGFGYGSTFNPTALGKISLLDNIFTSSTAGLVSTFIEMGNLNAQPTIMSTGGAFRWLMGVEPDIVSMGRGLQFKIKRWNSFQVPNGATFYGASISTLVDTLNINSLGFVGVNCNSPAYQLDVNGTGRTRIIISTLTTNPTFAANSFGQYFNMSNTGITGATLPSLAAGDNGWFVVMRNNTAVTLNMAWSGTTTGLPASSNTIPASNSLTLAWNGSAFIYY